MNRPAQKTHGADEADIEATIQLWKDGGLSPSDVWKALGNDMAWDVEWYEVKAFMRGRYVPAQRIEKIAA